MGVTVFIRLITALMHIMMSSSNEIVCGSAKKMNKGFIISSMATAKWGMYSLRSTITLITFQHLLMIT